MENNQINKSTEKLEIKDALPQFYLPYSAYVIQTRALPDARDGLKQGARFILYSQYLDKLTYDKKKRKAVATVNAGMRFSPHGDASVYGTAVRLSQNFSLRYPVISVQGNNGSMLHGDDYSAARYIEMGSNKIAYEMTRLLPKDTVDLWKLNYTQEEKYPSILPTTFPFSLVNGNSGIGVGCASSIPQFNLCEVSDALIKLMDNPNSAFEDLYCPIDFASGAILVNEEEVKESLKNGKGKAAKLRAKIEYDADKNELLVTELPYQVFTSTISSQIQKAIDENKLFGVSSFFDGTDFTGTKIVIKLNKNANVDRVCKSLYKETSLQHHFSINMMMLEDGRTPRIYSWTDMLKTYLTHLKTVLRKSYEYDLKTNSAKLKILEAYFKATEDIDNIVKIIKSSTSSSAAKDKLMQTYSFSEPQAKAILELKLQRLVNLERVKIEKDYESLNEKVKALQFILNNAKEFSNEVKREILRIKKEYGDARRTKNINLSFNNENDDEPSEKKSLICYLTSVGDIFINETSSLITQRRGGKGSKIRLSPNEAIVDSINGENSENCLFFTNKGKVYCSLLDKLELNVRVKLGAIFDFESNEYVTNIIPVDRKSEKEYLIFITKQGLIKKTPLSEYRLKKTKGVIAIKLKDGDELISIIPVSNESLGLLTHNKYFLMISTEDINPIGRATSGIKAIKLSDNDFVVSAQCITPDAKEIISISENGLSKRINIADFTVGNRATKGSSIQSLKDNDFMVDFLPITSKEKFITAVSNKRVIKIKIEDLSLLSRNATGVKIQSLDENEKICRLLGGKE